MAHRGIGKVGKIEKIGGPALSEEERAKVEEFATEEWTVGRYLIARLAGLGAGHLFGVTGDFTLAFNNLISTLSQDQTFTQRHGPVTFVNTCNELNAGYAADGYARMKGIGAVCTTYGVGELSVLNAIAGCYAERVPVVHITGAPQRQAYVHQLPLHHTLGDYDIPRKIYKKVTVAAKILADPKMAPQLIDRALALCLFHQRPVYLSLPCDVVNQPCEAPMSSVESLRSIGRWFPRLAYVNPQALAEAIKEAADILNAASKPVVVLDVECHRYGVTPYARALIEKTKYPFAATMMGKSLIEEQHPQFIGLYMGSSSRDYVQQRVEEADAVLQIGLQVTDLNTGGFTANINPEVAITATYQAVQIRNHRYDHVPLREFLEGLTKVLIAESADSPRVAQFDLRPAKFEAFHRASRPFQFRSGKLTMSRFFDRLAHSLPDDCIVVAETGNALFGAAETLLPLGANFVAQVFYASIGFSLGCALGVALAAPHRPVVLIIGDGSYQVVMQDHATIIRLGLSNVTMFLLNNEGYTIERLIQDGPFNDIPNLQYSKLPLVLGDSREGQCVATEEALDTVLGLGALPKGIGFIEVKTDRFDTVETLRKATQKMKTRTNVEEALAVPSQPPIPLEKLGPRAEESPGGETIPV